MRKMNRDAPRLRKEINIIFNFEHNTFYSDVI